MSASKADLARLARRNIARGAPIVGFTGINGAGKTLLAAQSIVHDLARGRDVFSTLQVTTEWGSTMPILSLGQLLELRDATLFLDEIAVMFSSDSSNSLPAEVGVLLQVLRHRGLTVVWTAPSWMRAHNKVRDVTQAAVNVIPMLRGGGGLWPTPRLIMAGVLDTTEGKTDSAPTRILRRRAFLPRRLEAWGAYDTLADTPIYGHRTAGGMCVDCHGSQTRPKCSEERHNELGIPWIEPGSLRVQRVATPLDVAHATVSFKDETPAQGPGFAETEIAPLYDTA